MSQCARCGAENQPTNRYCLSCGAPVAAALPGQKLASGPPLGPPSAEYAATIQSASDSPPGAARISAPPLDVPPMNQPADPYGPTAPPPYENFVSRARPPQAVVPVGQAAPKPAPIIVAPPPIAEERIPWAPPQGSSQQGGVSPVSPAGLDPELVEPGAPRTLAGFLVSYDQTPLGAFWPVFQGTNLVGRRGAAPGLDIEIDHPTTSSRHAVLYASARPGRVKVEDTSSTNGTFLGDRALDRGRKHELRDGDLIRFGAFSGIIKLV